MQRESYWDYMGRRLREDRASRISLNSVERDLYQRIEELERKVSLLGGDPKQLEMDV